MKFLSLSSRLALMLVSLLFFQCKEEAPRERPVVTLATTSITANSAFAEGLVSSDGGVAVIAKGICWSPTNKIPTTSDNKTIDGTGPGDFSSEMKGLTPGTTYYVRAYATNSVGTGYSSIVSFKTLALLPAVTTTEPSDITTTSLKIGGNITTDGGSAITARGVCWSTNMGPTTENNKTSDGTGTGIFSSTITGLKAGTTYYVKSYATNSLGTTYGPQFTVTTNAEVGQYKAYVIVESNETAVRTDLVNYMKSKQIPNSSFIGFNFIVPSQDQATFDAQMNAYLSYPGWGSTQPSIFSGSIPTTSGGLDKYGVYSSAYQFQTIEVPGNTLPIGVYGQFIVLVPAEALNGNRYSSILSGPSPGSFTQYWFSSFNYPIKDLTIHYTGSVNIPKGDYKLFYTSMGFRFPTNGSPVYFHGGAVVPY